MKIGTKRKMRHFQLKISLGGDPMDRWTREVIQGIENDETCVYHPDDDEALALRMTANGDVVMEERATLPVSIREWLPIGCQLIRWQRFESNETLGIYQNNATQVLWPRLGEYKPAGPCAFVGTIGLASGVGVGESAFKCLVAHELVHVFDMLRFLVPAFMRWDAFWLHVLGGGSRCDALWTDFGARSQFVDSYGAVQEIGELRRYWPAHADAWFDAFNKKWRTEET